MQTGWTHKKVCSHGIHRQLILHLNSCAPLEIFELTSNDSEKRARYVTCLPQFITAQRVILQKKNQMKQENKQARTTQQTASM